MRQRTPSSICRINRISGCPAGRDDGGLGRLRQWGSERVYQPADSRGAIGYAGSGAEHEPCYAHWAYLRTGELQYLDFITENGIGQILQSPKDFRNPSPSSGGPYAAYGVVLNWNDAGGELRSMGWAHRDVQIAALIHPWNPATGTDTLDSTTQIGQYLNDLADANANYPIDQFNAGSTVYGAQAAYVQARGLWAPYFKGIGYGNNGPEWELCYIGMSMCWLRCAGTRRRGNSSATSWRAAGTISGSTTRAEPPMASGTFTTTGRSSAYLTKACPVRSSHR